MNLSYSSLELLHTCPRKFEQEKLLTPDDVTQASLDLITGSALGIGLQSLLCGKDLNAAAWDAYCAWTFPRDARTVSIFEESKKKSFWRVLIHLQRFAATNPFDGWQLWTLPSGKPAIEVGFRIALPNGFNYRGFIDAILCREDARGALELCPVEIKSSGTRDPHPAMFQNSFQGTSYAAVVDFISGRKNDLLKYLVCTFPDCEQFVMDFYKTPRDKLVWLPALALDVQAIGSYKKQNHFPMRGGSCFNYFRPCPHLGVCNLERTTQYIEQVPDVHEYDFEFTLQELIAGLNGNN